jgi:GH15 family glucan-1,4-alpha-glucosidase
MQHPIGEHALLADRRTAALVDPDGNIGWLCWPWIDSTPLFFSLLDDERGGRFSVRPTRDDAQVISRRYHPRSLVLETTWEIGAGRLIVEDALTLDGGPEVVRQVRAQGEPVDVSVLVRAPRWPGAEAAIRTTDGVLEIRTEETCVTVRTTSEWTSHDGDLRSRLVAQPNATALITLSASGAQPPRAAIEETLAAWSRLIPERDPRDVPPGHLYADPEDLLGTTAAVLVGLHRSGGGIVAAPTTSLPQWPGSGRTWDYRYSWLRDSSLAGLAMVRLGLIDGARELAQFIGRVIAERGPVPLVRVDGNAAPHEAEQGALAGYGGARPVRIGNAAAGQPQLDVPGEVIELATALAEIGALPDELGATVPALANWLVQHWQEPDHGIWEIRGDAVRYTHSLVTAASGLAGAVGLADRGLTAGDAGPWRATASEIINAIGATGGALQLRLDGGGADAALAQVALLRGLEPLAARVQPTLGLIVYRLGRAGLVDRYEGQADTLPDPCGPFVFPTFWLAAALAATGRDGSAWLSAAIATRGPLGLFGEVTDPSDHTPLGNYPQVQSHAAFVLAVTTSNRPS